MRQPQITSIPFSDKLTENCQLSTIQYMIEKSCSSRELSRITMAAYFDFLEITKEELILLT